LQIGPVVFATAIDIYIELGVFCHHVGPEEWASECSQAMQSQLMLLFDLILQREGVQQIYRSDLACLHSAASCVNFMVQTPV